MSFNANSSKLVKSNTYEFRSDIKMSIHYKVIAPNGESIGDTFSSYRDMLNELMQSEIGKQVRAEYFDSDGERNPSDDGLDDYAWKHLKEVAEDMGYRILDVLVKE